MPGTSPPRSSWSSRDSTSPGASTRRPSTVAPCTAREPAMSSRFRYGAWRGGPDPLAPPYDLRKVLDEVGQDVLAGGSLREALRDLMRRGVDGRRGLEELQQRVRRARRQARQR